jgi:hypothetical protein
MKITSKKANAVLFIFIVILLLFLFLIFSKGTKKTTLQPNKAGTIIAESDISVRKALSIGIKESMDSGLNGLNESIGDAWFCNKVFPPDLVEAKLNLDNKTKEEVEKFLNKRVEEGYYENLTGIDVKIDYPSSEWMNLDDSYLEVSAEEFLSGIESPEFTTIKNNTEQYTLNTKVWYLYKNIINWMQDTQAGDITNLLTNVIQGIKPCEAVNSECSCPGSLDETILPNGVIDTMHVTWEEISSDMMDVENAIETNINDYFSGNGINITCEVIMLIDNSESYVVNYDQYDYRQGPTNIGTDSSTSDGGEMIILESLCPCEAPPGPPACRVNFLNSPNLSALPTGFSQTSCENAVAPNGLYARFEYVGVDRTLGSNLEITCSNNDAIMDGDRNFIPNIMKFKIRSYVMDECNPPLSAINSPNTVCWDMTEENVGPNCEFLSGDPGINIDPLIPDVNPEGISCTRCSDPIYYYPDPINSPSERYINGCNDGTTFPTDNPDFFNNDDCAAVLQVCQNNPP